MKRPLIVANWKLYVKTREDALAKARVIARGAKKIDVQLVVCPPMPFIEGVQPSLSRAGVFLGTQAVSTNSIDTRTGEVTAQMVASLGVSYVIVGHSERRAMGEEGEHIRNRMQAAFDAKLSPILCIGEQSRDPASGDHFAVIENQLRDALFQIIPRDVKKLVIAYEPVWAIGKTAADAMTPGEVEETAIYVRKVLVELLGRASALAVPILYGGSVEPSNAADLMRAGVSGFLVGHASVEPKSLLAIAQAARTRIR